MVRWNVEKVVDELNRGFSLVYYALNYNDHRNGNRLFSAFGLLVALHQLLVLFGLLIEAEDETRPAAQVTVALLLPALLQPRRIL